MISHPLTRSLFIGLIAFLLSACGGESNDNSGMLRITTTPGDAQILINGQRRGNSPSQAGQTFAIRLGEGTYIIEARKAVGEHHEFFGRREDVFVADGTLQTFHLDLQHQLNAQTAAEYQRLFKERYRDHGNGTVTDTQTGLMWMRCSIGQRWNGTTCTGEATRHNWAAANRFTNNHRFAGHSDWRLPTIDELSSLVYCSSGKRRSFERPNGRFVVEVNGRCEGDFLRPTINQHAFPASPRMFVWSSSTLSSDSNSAWFVKFSRGDASPGDVYESRNWPVLLVRGGQ